MQRVLNTVENQPRFSYLQEFTVHYIFNFNASLNGLSQYFFFFSVKLA